MNKYILFLILLVGCQDPKPISLPTVEVFDCDYEIHTIKIDVCFDSSYTRQSEANSKRIERVNDALKSLKDKKIISVVDIPEQGGARGIEVVCKDDNQPHSYFCKISKSPRLKGMVAVTSISGWRGGLAYYLCILDSEEHDNPQHD
jgi:hypothetical protein